MHGTTGFTLHVSSRANNKPYSPQSGTDCADCGTVSDDSCLSAHNGLVLLWNTPLSLMVSFIPGKCEDARLVGSGACAYGTDATDCERTVNDEGDDSAPDDTR